MKTIESLPPSVFTFRPSNSTIGKWEAEVVACNIMVIREQLGDKWPLTWSQYKARRISHGNDFSMVEKPYFEEVIKLIGNPVDAMTFAPCWAAAAKRAVKKAAATAA